MLPMKMIDEASYQGNEWTPARLQAAGIQIVAVKATEGIGYLNPFYAAQVTAARVAKCAVMHYHVAHPANPSDKEFDYFESHALAGPGDLIMVDCEPQIFTLPPAVQSAWLENFTRFISSKWPGVTPVIYETGILISDGSTESVRDRLPLFLAVPGADPANPPAPPQPWLLSFLQYGEAAGTDQDAAYFGSLAQLQKLAIPLPAPRPPVPPMPPTPPPVTAPQADDALVVLAAAAPAGDRAAQGAAALLRQFIDQHS